MQDFPLGHELTHQLTLKLISVVLFLVFQVLVAFHHERISMHVFTCVYKGYACTCSLVFTKDMHARVHLCLQRISMHVFTCVYIEAQHLLLSQWLWHVCGTKTLTESYISPFTCPGSLLQYGFGLENALFGGNDVCSESSVQCRLGGQCACLCHPNCNNMVDPPLHPPLT